jgi:hypothetical protein
MKALSQSSLENSIQEIFWNKILKNTVQILGEFVDVIIVSLLLFTWIDEVCKSMITNFKIMKIVIKNFQWI